jgi:hypothetical protein
MPINVFSLDDGNDARMFYDLNGQEYNYYTDMNALTSYDVVTLGGPTNPDPMPVCRLKLELAIWHNFEFQSKFGHYTRPEAIKNHNDTVIVTNAYDPVNDNHQWVIHYDFLFNRTKAYYLVYPWNPMTRRWYYPSPEAYVLDDIGSADSKQKIYVAPNNTHPNHEHRKPKYRKELVNLLKTNYRSQGYIGDYEADRELFLYSQFELSQCHTIQELENTRQRMQHGTSGYTPPHNLYYKNTFVSIYGETIEYGTSLAITEKTFDPLIKGHFILPFSAPGFLDRVRLLGFKLPDFINYEYDTIQDDDQRYSAYTDEIQRLMSLSLDQWRQHWTDNLDLIKHNRNIFWTRDYDRVDLAKYL